MKDFKLDTNEKINSGFKVPEDYFATFSEKMKLQLPNVEPKVISFYAKNSSRMYSIAAILVLALFIPIINQLQSIQNELTTREVETYITQHTTVSDDDIVNLLDQEDIDDLKIEAPIEEEALEDLLSTDSDLENYITN